MRNLKYILIFLPLFTYGQFPDLLQLASWQKNNATPSNLYTTANAANPTETNATTGFSLSNGSATIESSNSGATPTNGSYFIKITHTGANNTGLNVRETISGMLTVGNTYEISFDVNRIARPFASGNVFVYIQNSAFSNLASSGALATSSGWNNKVLSFTASSGNIYLTINYGSTTGTGDIVGLDNIIITDTTP